MQTSVRLCDHPNNEHDEFIRYIDQESYTQYVDIDYLPTQPFTYITYKYRKAEVQVTINGGSASERLIEQAHQTGILWVSCRLNKLPVIGKNVPSFESIEIKTSG